MVFFDWHVSFFSVLSPALLLVFSFMQGLGNAAYLAAWQAAIGILSSKKTLDENVAKNSISFNVACIMGPMVAARISNGFGYAAIFFIDAVSFLLFFIACTFITLMESRSVKNEVQVRPLIKARAIELPLKKVLLVMFVMIVGANALWSLLPVLVELYFPIESDAYGKALSCLGGGALLWGMLSLVPKLLKFRSGLRRVAPLLIGLAMVALPGLDHFGCFLVALVVSGFAWASLTTFFNFEVLRLSHPENRAAVMSLHGVIFNLAIFSNSLIWGGLVWIMGVKDTFLFTAAWLVVAGWLVVKIKKGGLC